MSEPNRNQLPLDSAESHSSSPPSDASVQPAPSKVLTASEEEPGQKAGGTQASVQMVRPRMISERKLLANRANAKKSTGPRTERGKAYSSRNAVTHGLLCEKGLFAPDGAPIDPELRALCERLRKESVIDDERADELLQAIIVEWSHQQRALKLEEKCLQNAMDDDASTVSLSKLQRYRTTSRQLLLKNLVRLRRRAGAPR